MEHICGDPNSPCDCICMEKAYNQQHERVRKLLEDKVPLDLIARQLNIKWADVVRHMDKVAKKDGKHSKR